MATKFKLILEKAVSITEHTTHFIFKTDIAEGLEFKAGQFISLHIEKDGKEHRRNYSIANDPGKENMVELAMTFVPNGLASTLMFGLEPGQSVSASGAYGQFILKDEVPPKRYIMIGTGTGVTPYLSMLTQLGTLIEGDSLEEVVILQGVRTENDLLYREEFTDFAKRYPNVIFKACYSRGCSAEAKGYEVEGYVQNQLSALNISPENDIAYLCGNPQMVDAAFSELQELGLDRKQIRREKYVPSK